MIKQTIGLIGAGNMGTAILESLLEKQKAAGAQIWVYDKITDKAADFAAKWKTRKASSNAELVKNTEIIILAVKPQDLEATASELKGQWTSKHILISILAGTPLVKIRGFTGASPALVRAMPNLGAKVGQSLTALAGDPDAVKIAAEIFTGCGKTVILEEKYFDLVTAISGSGPAYFFHMMELMAREGVENGLNEKDARLLAVQTALGAALLADQSPESPAELRKMVTSKGGTTEAALKVLGEGNFPELFHQALQAALKRGKELSQS